MLGLAIEGIYISKQSGLERTVGLFFDQLFESLELFQLLLHQVVVALGEAQQLKILRFGAVYHKETLLSLRFCAAQAPPVLLAFIPLVHSPWLCARL